MPADLYATITAQIIEKLESGTMPWRKPWSGVSAGPKGLPAWWPRNASSGRPYSGINVWILSTTSYADPRWLTFNQAKAAGGSVRKGEKGQHVTFFRFVECKDDPKKKIPVIRGFVVFNIDQCENLDAKKLADLPGVLPESLTAEWKSARVAAAVDGMKADGVRFRTGDSAFYRIDADSITLPPLSAFDSEGDAAVTALHEMAHATGAEKRCNRQFGKRFGDEAYAAEELVAEIAAAYLGAESGVEGQMPQHASYLAHWLQILKADKHAIFTAAREAQKAADFIAERAGWRVAEDEAEEAA